MKIEVNKNYTYETMPEYTEEVEGAKCIEMTGDEIYTEYFPDVVYSEKDGVELHLQILKPKNFFAPDRLYPCVLFVQGSAWMKQHIHKNVGNLARLASLGYVCAIVEYRHSGISKFPAQIIDAKNAIRFMKRNATTYNVDPQKVIIMGDSSGGHVSCITGMTANAWELDEPSFRDVNPSVKGIIDLYGAVDPTLPYGFPTTEDHQKPTSPEGMLMGYDINEHLEEAKVAVAKHYVSDKYEFAPILILHGTKDKTVFCEESVQLYKALKAANKDVEFYFVKGSDHGGAAFWKEEALAVYDKFIKRCLEK